MAGFVQIIEFKTSRIAQIRALVQEYRETRMAEGGGAVPTRGILTSDRDRPGYYLNIVEFPSYEMAMENSERPDTTAMAARLAELCDEPPRFYNLDLTEVWTTGAAAAGTSEPAAAP